MSAKARNRTDRRRPQPEEAPPTLLWKVMERLDRYERQRTLRQRWMAAGGLAAALMLGRRNKRSKPEP